MRIDFVFFNEAFVNKYHPSCVVTKNNITDFLSDHYPIYCSWTNVNFNFYGEE